MSYCKGACLLDQIDVIILGEILNFIHSVSFFARGSKCREKVMGQIIISLFGIPNIGKVKNCKDVTARSLLRRLLLSKLIKFNATKSSACCEKDGCISYGEMPGGVSVHTGNQFYFTKILCICHFENSDTLQKTDFFSGIRGRFDAALPLGSIYET